MLRAFLATVLAALCLSGLSARSDEAPLLFLTRKILETEPCRSDRFEVGFGLATAAR